MSVRRNVSLRLNLRHYRKGKTSNKYLEVLSRIKMRKGRIITMKKPAWLLATALIVAMSFTACGPKNTDTVSKDDNTLVVSESTEKSSDKITSEDKTSDKNVDKQDSEKTESTESTDVSKKDDTTKFESVSDKKSDKSDNKSNSNSTSNKKKTGTGNVVISF